MRKCAIYAIMHELELSNGKRSYYKMGQECDMERTCL